MRRRFRVTSDALENARRCGAFYSCPKKPGTNERLGPLVAYAGTYPVPGVEAKNEPHFVGDIYFNFAKVETQGDMLAWYADAAFNKLCGCSAVSSYSHRLVLCTAPLGGYKFGDAISARHDFHAIMAEKRVTRAGDDNHKEESKVVFSRHAPDEGDVVVITEDVCNNFKTTGNLCFSIIQQKAKPIAILCVLNRSMTVDTEWSHSGKFTLQGGEVVDVGPISLPVISVIHMPYGEYRQDDPFVADDVARGNICHNPKRAEEWSRLMQAMADAGAQ